MRLGPRVVDRLSPGLTSRELDQYQASAGCELPPQVREWFGWANGHVPGAMDPDDTSARLLPFGRQMSAAEGVAYIDSISVAMYQQDPPYPNSPIVVLQSDTRTFMVDCGQGDGVVWLWDVTALFEPIFGSLREMLENCLALLGHDLVRLDFLGGAYLVSPNEVESTGITFESEWERFRYQSYGCLPSALLN